MKHNFWESIRKYDKFCELSCNYKSLILFVEFYSLDFDF